MAISFSFNVPKKSLKFSYFDKKVNSLVENVSVENIAKVAAIDPTREFISPIANGVGEVLNLSNIIDTSIEEFIPREDCRRTKRPLPCGPPRVEFFGGGGYGAKANAIIDGETNTLIAFDVIDGGSGYQLPPQVKVIDICGKGSGYCARAILNDSGSVEKVYVCAGGDGYIAQPDGSLGGNGRVWKEANEPYVEKEDGTLIALPPDVTPTLDEGDRYFPPTVVDDPVTPTTPTTPVIPTTPVTPTTPVLSVDPGRGGTEDSYEVILEIDDIVIEDPGFDYKPTDQIVITPDNGAKLVPIINGKGEVETVVVVNPGLGFTGFPVIRIESETGYNAEINPIFKPRRVDEVKEQIAQNGRPIPVITVIDCVNTLGRTP